MKQLIIILVILITLVSCDKKEEPTSIQKPIAGFSQVSDESSWKQCETYSILTSSENFEIDVLYKNASQKKSTQIEDLRAFIAYKVDFIILSPISEDGFKYPLTEAKMAGIPVILLDRKIKEDDSLYSVYIGPDYVAEGKLAGEYLTKKFENENRKINIVEIRGTENSTPTLERAEGFYSLISNDTKFNILSIKTGDFMTSKGEELTQNLIDEFSDIDVIFSHSDSMTKGILTALDEKGILPGEEIVIISFDGEQQAIDELVDGRINCIVSSTPYLGDQVIEIMNALKKREELPKHIYTDPVILTEYDDLTDLSPRGY